MRLYTDQKGNWRGTQADAKKDLDQWDTTDVPTSKAELLEFLNVHKVGAANVIKPVKYVTPTSSHEFVHDDEREVVAIKPRVSPIDKSNLKNAFEQAGAARESLKRVFEKLKELEEVH
tara:strand:+ start:128 stop:481 length:354 start_codon:yes stop_codon:yes gene_type:complete